MLTYPAGFPSVALKQGLAYEWEGFYLKNDGKKEWKRERETESQKEKYQNEDRLKDEQDGKKTERKTKTKLESEKDKMTYLKNRIDVTTLPIL